MRIELWPGGSRDRATVLGEAAVANDGSGSEEIGNYVAVLSKKGGFKKLRPLVEGGAWRSARVDGFPRLRLGVWDLLFRVLRAAVGSRNAETNSARSLAPQPEKRRLRSRSA